MLKPIIVISGTVAGAALLAFMVLSGPGPAAVAADQVRADSQPGVASGIPASAAGTVVPAFARANAIAYVRGLTAAFPRIDRIDAKLTTWGEWNRQHGISPSANGTDPNKLVWIVGASGEHITFIGHGMHMPWGGVIIDATTGAVLASEGGPTGTPGYFNAMVDLAPR